MAGGSYCTQQNKRRLEWKRTVISVHCCLGQMTWAFFILLKSSVSHLQGCSLFTSPGVLRAN